MYPSVSFFPKPGHPCRSLALGITILAPFLLGFVSLYLGQDTNWDLRNYHWYNAYALIHGRYEKDILPSQTPWFYNPLIDVPYYLIGTAASAKSAGYFLGFVAGFNFVLLFMLSYASLLISTPRYRVLSAAVLASLGLWGGGATALLGTTFYDNITSLGLFLSIILVANVVAEDSAVGHLASYFKIALSGLPLGLVVGLKLPVVIFAVGFASALMTLSVPIKRRLIIASYFGIGMIIGLLISLGPWAIFLNQHFSSPLFPYFNEYFKSPLAPLTSARDIQFIPHTVRDILLFPILFSHEPRRVGEIPFQDYRIACLYLILPFSLLLYMLFGRFKHDPQSYIHPFFRRYLLWGAVFTYWIWLFMFSIYRYAVPLEMLTPLLLVLTISLLPLRPKTSGLVISFLLLTIAVTVIPGNWGRRAFWLDHVVETTIPPLPDHNHLMILMTGFEPYSHLLTVFPQEIEFLRIESNFVSPGEPKGFNQLIARRLHDHQGPLMLLIPSWQHDLATQALAFYRLSYNRKTCQKVQDRLYDDQTYFDLCRVNP